MTPTLQQRCLRVLAGGPAHSGEVAAILGEEPRKVSATLKKLLNQGKIVRSDERVAREQMPSVWMYSVRHKQWRHWTTRDIETLRTMEGQRPEVIARALGRTAPSVRNQANRIGVKLPGRTLKVWPPETRFAAEMMRHRGTSEREIARALGVPRSTINSWLAGRR